MSRMVCLLILVLAHPSGFGANDRCEKALPLAVPSTTFGSTVGAAGSPKVDQEVCPDFTWYSAPTAGLWYTVVGTGNRMTASTCNPGSDFDTAVRVLCSDCDHPICVAVNDDSTSFDPSCYIPSDPSWPYASSVTWCSRAGQEYRIYVSGSFFAEGPFELTLSDSGTPCWGAADCAPVGVAATHLSDPIDNDGWADPHETVAMRVRLLNRGGTDLTGLEARLISDDPKIACVADMVMPLGDLAAGETVTTSGEFLFRVGGMNRRQPLEEFSADLGLVLTSDQFVDVTPPRCSMSGLPCTIDAECLDNDVCEERYCSSSGVPCNYIDGCGDGGSCIGTCSRTGNTCFTVVAYVPGVGRYVGCEGPDVCVDGSREVNIDLDLDALDGMDVTTFFEGFEGGDLGAFSPVNMDAGLGDVVASDGYRCQSSDPDNPAAGDPRGEWCCLNPVNADAFFWHLDTDRAFTGAQSVHMGVDRGGGVYSTPTGVLEAIALTEPIHLAWAPMCSVSKTPCWDDYECPAGESCRAAAPELSFKHQLDLMDWRTLTGVDIFWDFAGKTFDRAVVQARRVDRNGLPLEPWFNLEPYTNGYNAWPAENRPNCRFDPIDDGNTEDDRDPIDPNLGPSSTCFPQRVFSHAGDPTAPFDPLNVGGHDDGPGLEGETGTGTWVESRIDLAAFRGQSLQLRFLATTTETANSIDGGVDAWIDWFPGLDDGWWIDDVMVTDVLTLPALLDVDRKDNSAWALDTDEDCVADAVDCAPGDAAVWDVPGEVQQLRLIHTGGAGGTSTLSWIGPQASGGPAVDYVTIAMGPGLCDETSVGANLSAENTTNPAPGTLHTFLIRAENSCGLGTLGYNSEHEPRGGCD